MRLAGERLAEAREDQPGIGILIVDLGLGMGLGTGLSMGPVLVDGGVCKVEGKIERQGRREKSLVL